MADSRTKPEWTVEIGGAIRTTPVVGDVMVSVGSNDGCVYALAARDG